MKLKFYKNKTIAGWLRSSILEESKTRYLAIISWYNNRQNLNGINSTFLFCRFYKWGSALKDNNFHPCSICLRLDAILVMFRRSKMQRQTLLQQVSIFVKVVKIMKVSTLTLIFDTKLLKFLCFNLLQPTLYDSQYNTQGTSTSFETREVCG